MNINYTYAGPALLVLPLFLCSIVNLFIAGPPLKTVVLDSSGSSYGASLPFMQLRVQGSQAKFNIYPTDEITHFFVVTCYAPAASNSVYLDAQIQGKPVGSEEMIALTSDNTMRYTAHMSSQLLLSHDRHVLQMMQPLLGYSEYQVLIRSLSGKDAAVKEVPLPAMEYRLTYVPTRFTYTQICVRAFFTFTSLCILVAYTLAMVRTNTMLEHGQLWMTALLLLLLALNDPLYIVRVVVGGNQLMYSASVMGQILFSGVLFMFWLVYADGMNSATVQRPFCSFYLPKLLLVSSYVIVSAIMFVLHGRVPDRINVSEVHGVAGQDQYTLIASLSASLVGIGAWLSFLVARAIYRLGWKKVEYIYTEREKSFVGITMVFVILWLCGHLYRAQHGRRGSWMQLQLPFLTLTNSYLALLTHAFWPGESAGDIRPAERGSAERDESKQQGLLEDDD